MQHVYTYNVMSVAYNYTCHLTYSSIKWYANCK